MNRIIIILVIVILAACTSDNPIKQDSILLEAGQFPQKWELVAMSGMIANVPPTQGDDMTWQEHYILAADGTFVKTRDYNDEQIVATGVYELVKLEDGDYLRLAHKSHNEIIGNCGNSPEEYLRFEISNSLVGTWWACDGPGLFYERTQ